MNEYYSGAPLKIGNETQLLIDDTIVEDRWRLTRVMHHPDKFPRNPVLLRDKPWESDTVQGPHVIWDEEYGKYRMWYLCFNNSVYFHGSGAVEYMAYAESDDGFNWTKPLFDHCPYGPHKKTNIVYYGTHDQGTYINPSKWPGLPVTRIQAVVASQVFKDDRERDPARRYKMITLEGRHKPDIGEVHVGVEMSCSPDGIHWKLANEKPLLDHSSDCKNHVVWDEKNQQWLMYCRPPVWHSGRQHNGRNIRRRVAVMTSKDFVHWTYPRTVLVPDEYDTPDYDHVQVFRYGNLYLMLYGAMEGDTTGRWELRLATSPDGLHWERYHTRETYLGRGPVGSFDGGGVLPSCPPIRQGEHLLLYYSAFIRGQEEQGDFGGSIGLATIKLDRFVEQRAGETPGYLLTKEFILEGKSLRVNVECHKSTNLAVRPRLRVEILKHPRHGEHWDFKEAYEGFSFDDCDPLNIDHTDATVTWKGKSDLSALVGKPVYVRFELVNTGIFSFRIAKE